MLKVYERVYGFRNEPGWKLWLKFELYDRHDTMKKQPNAFLLGRNNHGDTRQTNRVLLWWKCHKRILCLPFCSLHFFIPVPIFFSFFFSLTEKERRQSLWWIVLTRCHDYDDNKVTNCSSLENEKIWNAVSCFRLRESYIVIMCLWNLFYFALYCHPDKNFIKKRINRFISKFNKIIYI